MQRRSFLAGAGAVLAGCAAAGPAERGDGVLEVARANGLTRFVAAVDQAGLTERLSGPGFHTLFAPTNGAFAAAERTADPGRLVAYHVVPGMLGSSFLDGFDLNHTTVTGTSLNVDGTGGALRVNGAARIVTADLVAANGVVHVIDRVLVPR